VILTGESGSGKTTTVAALVLEGYGYLSDEAAVIGLDAPLLQPWPRPLHFKPEAQSIERFQRLFESPEPRGRNVRAECLRAGALGAPCKVRHIIDYRYVPGAATKVDPVSRAEALALLGSASPGLRHHGERGLRVLADVVGDACAYRLRSGDLSQAVSAVRALAEP
jgi:hypothetical protein